MKRCKQCTKEFEVTDSDREFYKKIDVPEPTLCPDCRQQRRISFRNFKTLYNHTSALSGKKLISMYSPESGIPVYSHEEWWGDQWDPKSYGIAIDFSRPFFEQFNELFVRVPKLNLMNTKSENCLYSNMTVGSKNCYLVFGCLNDENCDYGHIVWNSRDCVDNLYVINSELCYECIDCDTCYNVHYSQECEHCNESVGLFDCRNCTSCIGCVGLNNKTYHVFNKPVTEQEYREFMKSHPRYEQDSIRFILSEQQKLRHSLPQRSFFGYRNEDVSGNHIYNAKNVHYSFDVRGGENSKYIFTGRTAIDSYDCSFFPECELGYQNVFCVGRMIMGSHLCIECHDVWYSDACFSSNNLFGCAGLRNANNCILNTQYTPEEFISLKARLVEHMKKTGEWGEFFPPSMSPFAYNESIVNEYTPLTKEDALARGFRWSDTLPGTSGQETITHENLPTDPAQYSDALTQHILSCKVCGKNYRYIRHEVEFYKKNGLPLPDRCFNCRHMARMNMRNPRTLWRRQCMCEREGHDHTRRCTVEFETTYAPERPELVYCEPCYQKEMV